MAGAYRETTRADVFADSLRLPFAEGAFDTAIATQVLEHLGRPVDFLQEIARVLRPGGVLILSAPMTWPLHEEPHDYFRYTIHGLRRLARDAGLEVLAEVPRGGAAATLGQMFLDLYVANPQPVGCLRHTLGKALSLVVNWKCLCLDRLAPRPRLCLGWAIAARKPPSAGRA
jgi:SAM-dependent methyltransferase